MSTTSQDPWRHFWAKAPYQFLNPDDPNYMKHDETDYHPLFCHMIDVAEVAGALLDVYVPERHLKVLAGTFQMTTERFKRFISFVFALHDAGKATLPFQKKNILRHADLKAVGFKFPSTDELPHGTLSARIILDTLAYLMLPERPVPTRASSDKSFEPLDEDTWDNAFPYKVANIVGGHHGRFPDIHDWTNLDFGYPFTRQLGDDFWWEQRWQLILALADLYGIEDLTDIPANLKVEGLDALLVVLNGRLTDNDWLASFEHYFPYQSDHEINLADYKEFAHGRAVTALQDIGRQSFGLGGDMPRTVDFKETFGFEPSPLQDAMSEVAAAIDRDEPFLAIIEAPMGEGKTEASLYLTMLAGVDQFYKAMPTQGTSNLMYYRDRDHLAKVYKDMPVPLVLAHSHSEFVAEFTNSKVMSINEIALGAIYDDATPKKATTSNVVSPDWYTPSKRRLLSPFGVGTIDQVLLGVLMTKHFSLRLSGLSGKMVIFDEVHSYDAYTTELLAHALKWLAAIKSPVILLSATLPKGRREQLVNSYRSGLNHRPMLGEAVPYAHYPRVTWVSGKEAPRVMEVGFSESSLKKPTVKLAWLPYSSAPVSDVHDADFKPLIRHIADKAERNGGGCFCVIFNTVRMAQAAYEALRTAFPGDADDGLPIVDLYHAQTTIAARAEHEKRALVRFGKEGTQIGFDGDGEKTPVRRPTFAILVATPVVEQSLDLDFDDMVSELSPIDLLLQRDGREWRHHDRKNRVFFESPTLTILDPLMSEEAGVPDFGASGIIYRPYLLLLTWLILKRTEKFSMTQDIERLIREVYDAPILDGLPDHILGRIAATRKEMEKKADAQEKDAALQLLPDPWKPLLHHSFTPSNDFLFEENDDPSSRAYQNAKTRDAMPSIDVLILYRDEGGDLYTKVGGASLPNHAYVFAGGDEKPSFRDAERIHGNMVRVSSTRFVKATLKGEIGDRESVFFKPPAWKNNAQLRFAHILLLDEKGEAEVGDFSIKFSFEFGLKIKNN